MRKIIKKNIILILVLFTSIQAFAQNIIKQADQNFDLFNYEKAADLYKTAFEKNKTVHIAERLADSYRLMRDFKQAENWYAIATNMASAKVESTLWYAEMLKSNAKYAEAKLQYSKYASTNKDVNPTQLNKWNLACDSALKWFNSPKAVAIINEKSLNTVASDWGLVKYEDGMVFSSDRDGISKTNKEVKPFLKFDGNKLPDTRVYGWTGENYLRIYEQKNNSVISLFPILTTTEYHISSATFSEDGNEMYFAQTQIPKNISNIKGKPFTINIEIYSVKKENDVWGKPIAFRYNNNANYSVGDPFLAKDGKLYFASNMPGGKGGTDIYYCTRNTDGSWSDAINLDFINTTGNERTPTIGNDDLFYFSSDGQVGMGGLDIFSANILTKNAASVKNLGFPINSAQDDFAFIKMAKLSGFLSSNRDGGLGSDDIYSFSEKEPVVIKPVFTLEGKVLNKENNQPIIGAIVILAKQGGEAQNLVTDANGYFKATLNEATSYNLTASKTGFMRSSGTSEVSTIGLKKSENLTRTLYLNQIVIGKAIRIDNIFYDFDKSTIRPDAALELDKLVAVLIENPNITIELGSHTDSRGNDAYNLKLSQARATSAVNYIIAKGIAKDRITAKGYGETMLMNQCKNGVKCSDEEHQLNRRTEFKIIKQ